MPARAPDLDHRRFPSQAALERWLADQPDDAPGIWLDLAKKGTGIASVSYKEAVESGLCWGWIDGQALSIDDVFYAVRYTPRRARSRWSKVNRTAAEALMAQGRIQPPGQLQIDRAKADGRWDAAYDPPSTMQPTPELAAALAAEPHLRAAFDALPASKRFAIMRGVADAKRPETRTRRIVQALGELRAR